MSPFFKGGSKVRSLFKDKLLIHAKEERIMARDLSFIGRPHEYDPRRVFSLTGADWQDRVNFDRLRKERLARAKEQMEIHDLGALVVYDGANVRYLTSSFQGNWKYNIFIRYAVLPRGGEPILFETAGSDMECAKIDLPWMEGRIRPAITWKWSEGAVDYMVDRMADSVIEVLREHEVVK
jgi:Xaa-Pro aminopeptidase